MTDITLKIGVMVFNHARYIGSTLEGLLNQETKYSYHIYVFDDFSTDGSREIISKFANSYPGRITPVFNKQNLGDHWNLRSNFAKLDSPYFAILDGDDCWINNSKIERMVGFLEANPEFVGASHNVWLEFEDGRPSRPMNEKPFDRVTHSVRDLVSGYCYHHTSAILYRNVIGGRLPKVYFHPYAGDWFLSMMLAEHGAIRYFDEIWSVYRIHTSGMWSKLSEAQKKMRNIDASFHYNRLLNYKYDLEFGRIYADIAAVLADLDRSFTSFLYKIKYHLLIFALNSEHNRLRKIRRLFRPMVYIFCSNIRIKDLP